MAGSVFGTMVDYWAFTGDETYNDATIQAMVHQGGTDADFMPSNQTSTEGNDDQGFWAMAAMSAAENKFPDPPSDDAQWLALSQAVVNQYASRWDMSVCSGGLRWQIFTFNAGFDYKNSISNGCFFNMAARLQRYTGNTTYGDWAETVWDWMDFVGLITEDHRVLDGAGVRRGDNCTEIDTVTWSYNAGIFLHGAAAMYNHTGSDVWKDRVQKLYDATIKTFFRDNVAVEPQCEDSITCNTDQSSFKGYLLRWMAQTYLLAPFLASDIQEYLRATGAAAAVACSGASGDTFKGFAGTACGFSWQNGTFDGIVGVGEQMNALSAIMYNLVPTWEGPVTSDTGGTSKGNAAGGSSTKNIGQLKDITAGDRVGAGILTTLVLAGVLGGCAFVVT